MKTSLRFYLSACTIIFAFNGLQSQQQQQQEPDFLYNHRQINSMIGGLEAEVESATTRYEESNSYKERGQIEISTRYFALAKDDFDRALANITAFPVKLSQFEYSGVVFIGKSRPERTNDERKKFQKKLRELDQELNDLKFKLIQLKKDIINEDKGGVLATLESVKTPNASDDSIGHDLVNKLKECIEDRIKANDPNVKAEVLKLLAAVNNKDCEALSAMYRECYGEDPPNGCGSLSGGSIAGGGPGGGPGGNPGGGPGGNPGGGPGGNPGGGPGGNPGGGPGGGSGRLFNPNDTNVLGNIIGGETDPTFKDIMMKGKDCVDGLRAHNESGSAQAMQVRLVEAYNARDLNAIKAVVADCTGSLMEILTPDDIIDGIDYEEILSDWENGKKVVLRRFYSGAKDNSAITEEYKVTYERDSSSPMEKTSDGKFIVKVQVVETESQSIEWDLQIQDNKRELDGGNGYAVTVELTDSFGEGSFQVNSWSVTGSNQSSSGGNNFSFEIRDSGNFTVEARGQTSWGSRFVISKTLSVNL